MNRPLLLLACLLPAFLSACNNQPNYAYFITHPQLASKYYARCQQPSANLPGTTCASARLAMGELRELIVEAQLQPFAYGQRILHTQLQLAHLQRLGPPADLQAARLQLRKLRAVMNFAETVGWASL